MGGTSSETSAPKEVRHGCEHVSHPANAEAPPARAGCPWLGADRDDVGRRVGQRHDRRAAAGSTSRTSSPLGTAATRCTSPASTDQIQVRADKKLGRQPLLHQQLSVPGDVDGARTDGGSRCPGNGLVQGHQGQVARRVAVRVHVPQLGQPFIITDSSGKVVSRDRGNVTGRLHDRLRRRLVQLLGDKLAGPHPSFDVDLCLAVAPSRPAVTRRST